MNKTQRRTLNINSTPELFHLPFAAVKVFVSNPTFQWWYLRVGAQDAPNAQNADIVVPPFTFSSYSFSPAVDFGMQAQSVGTIPASVNAFGNCVVTFYDDDVFTQTTFTTLRDAATYPETKIATVNGATNYSVLLTCPANKRLVLTKAILAHGYLDGGGQIGIGFVISSTNKFVLLSNPAAGRESNLDFSPQGLYGNAGESLSAFNNMASFFQAIYTVATVPA